MLRKYKNNKRKSLQTMDPCVIRRYRSCNVDEQYGKFYRRLHLDDADAFYLCSRANVKIRLLEFSHFSVFVFFCAPSGVVVKCYFYKLIRAKWKSTLRYLLDKEEI